MNDFTIPFTKRQEQFSIAYVKAIASAAGYSVEEIRVDVDSVDVTITQTGNDNGYPLIEGLRVQLKCTYAYTPHNGYISFPLSMKNYNDLRRTSLNPRILILLYTPPEQEKWLEHHDLYMLLRYEAYWISLRGLPSRPNKNNITVRFDTNQRFTIDELHRLMNMLAVGQRP